MYKTILFIIVLGLLSCSPKTTPFLNAEVTYLNSTQKTVTLKSNGYGQDLESAIQNAEANAFKMLLFKGIPDSNLSDPLIIDEKTARQKSPAFFINLLKKGGLRVYVIESNIADPLEKDRRSGQKKLSVELKINLKSLKRDLENKKLINRFGF